MTANAKGMKPSERIREIKHKLQDKDDVSLLWEFGTTDHWFIAIMIYLNEQHEAKGEV